MAQVKLEQLCKSYEKTDVIENMDLTIDDGEFLVLVGPSGCGKSTILRMIAGLESISGGQIYIDGNTVNDVPPKDRDIAMVFQSYALYPHMNVYDNMAFGLKMRKTPKEQIDKQVSDTAKILDLAHLLERKPKELSGGQRQRVALGRAIVRSPKVFLMDEPLSNLDAKLRVHMRAEIQKLHRKLNVTTIYVTHDQTEAMTMGDRIVILHDGVIQQVGSPTEVYSEPQNQFVGGFIGSMMFITHRFEQGQLHFTDGTPWRLPEEICTMLNDKGFDGKDVTIGIRPEHFSPSDTAPHSQTLTVKPEIIETLGPEKLLHFTFEDQAMVASIPPDTSAEVDNQLTLAIDLNKATYFDPDNQSNILLKPVAVAAG